MLKCALITNFYSEMYKKATYHELSTLEVLVGCWTKYSFLANLGGNMWQSFLGSQTSTARWSVHTWHAYKNVPSWINPGLEVIPRLSCWSVGSCCACCLPLSTQAVHLDFLRSSNLDVLIKQAVHLECKKKKEKVSFSFVRKLLVSIDHCLLQYCICGCPVVKPKITWQLFFFFHAQKQ